MCTPLAFTMGTSVSARSVLAGFAGRQAQFSIARWHVPRVRD
jgi:hypothetical protein